RAWAAETWPSRALVAWPAVAVIAALLSFVPIQIAALRLSVNLARAPYDLVARHGLDNAVVFVQSIPSQLRRPGSWVHFLQNNSPDLTARVLFVRDLGAEKNERLIRYLRGRAPYVMGMQGGELTLAPLNSPG